jgi:ribosomal protein S18 acetylase RimI-like enzyme
MRDFRTTHERQALVRRMHWDDIPEILGIAGRTPAPSWIRPDFLPVFQSNETIGYVAVVRKRITGFALCSVSRPPVEFVCQGGTFLEKLCGWFRGEACCRPRHLELFGLGLASDGPRAEVERALLEEIVRDLEGSADVLQAVVPETSVSAQTFLQGHGFQAIRVFRSYYGQEDGYLMRREGAGLHPGNRSKRDAGSSRPSADGLSEGKRNRKQT